MSDFAIRVKNLSKQYEIGAAEKQFNRLGDQIVDSLVAPFRRAGKLLRGRARSAAELDETIWALRDVSLEIKHGEVVGIIGRNGAGKSTLLKILSRITEPTEGRVRLRGRVGSLLEVGTGFHQELTGRENVYLNGAILGMGKKEIDRKFDEIVAFAEIEKFIDTPVKFYSSGMYVRLAFAVAAHLEPEILMVDEVLAVGDLAFQKKCLGKMSGVAKQGRTVLFVSHNMGVIETLCERGILLEQGIVSADGTAQEAVESYIRSLEQIQSHDLAERTDRQGRGKIRLIGLDIMNCDLPSQTLRSGNNARFVFKLSGLISDMVCVFVIFDRLGRAVSVFKSNVIGVRDVTDPKIGAQFLCEFDQLMLLPGRYHLNVSIKGDGELQDKVEAAAIFDVEPGLLNGRPISPTPKNPTSVALPHRWIVPAR